MIKKKRKKAMACEKGITYPPQTFLDLVDDCLLMCEDECHDETWDKLVKDWALKLRNEAFENGTLFSKKWEEEEIPDFIEEEIKERRKVFYAKLAAQNAQQQHELEVAKKELEEDRIKDVQRDGKQQERMVLVEGREENRKREGAARLTELAMLPEKERGLVTPRLETMRESTKTEGKRRNRRGGRKSRRCRLLDFQTFLSKEYNLPPTRLMMEAVAQSLQSVGRRQGVRRSKAEESLSARSRSRRWGKRKQEEAELTASPVLPRSVIGNVQMEAKPSMAGRRQEKEAELIASSCLTSTRRSTLSPLTETMSASRANNPYMLRWSMLGVGEGERGLEMAWVDQWRGQGWAGPLSSVYFCQSCQLKEGL